MQLTIYNAKKCKWCKSLMKQFRAAGVPYKPIMIRHNNDAIRFLQEFNLYTVPQVFDEYGNHIGGYDQTIRYLKDNNKI